MARKRSPPTVVDVAPEALYHPPVNPGLAEVVDEHNRGQANAIALAEQLGYDGSLAVGALEDEIRFYQRRSVEALLAVGTRLILLKEQIAHGEFTQRIKLLGFSDRTARRFMQAALKTAKSANLAVLAGHIDGAGKFLELVTLDDDDLEALKEGGTVAGLTLDDVDRMSASELRAALREARENEAAMGRVLQEKNAKIDALAVDARKRKSAVKDAEWPETIDGLKDDAHGLSKFMDEIMAKYLLLIQATDQVYLDLPEDSALIDAYKGGVFQLGEHIERLCTLAAGLRNEYHLRLEGRVSLDRTHILPDEGGDLAG